MPQQAGQAGAWGPEPEGGPRHPQPRRGPQALGTMTCWLFAELPKGAQASTLALAANSGVSETSEVVFQNEKNLSIWQ